MARGEGFADMVYILAINEKPSKIFWVNVYFDHYGNKWNSREACILASRLGGKFPFYRIKVKCK